MPGKGVVIVGGEGMVAQAESLLLGKSLSPTFDATV